MPPFCVACEVQQLTLATISLPLSLPRAASHHALCAALSHTGLANLFYNYTGEAGECFDMAMAGPSTLGSEAG